MRDLKTLEPIDKLLGIAVIAFMVFVGAWLFGKRDFFTPGFGVCSEVWNPTQVIDAYTKQYTNTKFLVDCAPAADARREDIFFGSFIIFSALTSVFLYVSSSSKSDEESS